MSPEQYLAAVKEAVVEAVAAIEAKHDAAAMARAAEEEAAFERRQQAVREQNERIRAEQAFDRAVMLALNERQTIALERIAQFFGGWPRDSLGRMVALSSV